MSSDNVGENLQDLFQMLEASLKLKQTNIDIQSEFVKIMQKQINASLKDMIKSGEFSDIIKELGIFDSTGYGASSTDAKQKQSEIDEMVASALVSGVQTSNILKNLFGIVPSLIGR